MANDSGRRELVVSKLSGLVLLIVLAGCVSTGRRDLADDANGVPNIPAAGICWVGVWIEKSGAVSEAALIKSTGMHSIDTACLNAVRGQEFESRLIIDPILFNPGTIRRYTVVEMHWRHNSAAR